MRSQGTEAKSTWVASCCLHRDSTLFLYAPHVGARYPGGRRFSQELTSCTFCWLQSKDIPVRQILDGRKITPCQLLEGGGIMGVQGSTAGFGL